VGWYARLYLFLAQHRRFLFRLAGKTATFVVGVQEVQTQSNNLVRAHGKLSLWLKNMSRIPLRILGDFGLIPMSQNDQPLLLELIEDRYQSGSLIINSQLPTKLWRDQFADKTLADAIMDRIVHNAEKIELKGESMRKNPAQTR
jgi:DNA replication protein DnaC